MTSVPATSSRLAAALRYAGLGWRVFPCHWVTADGRCSCGRDPCPDRPGKHPFVDRRLGLTRGCKDATADPDTLRRWWGELPDANPAVATGPESGVWVLGPDGEAGVLQLGELMAENQPEGELFPATPLAQSGSGGRHLYFRWPSDNLPVTNRVNHRGLKIDVRGAGGYVVAPPGVNANGRYEWLDRPWDVPPPEAPAWLLAWVRGKDDPAPAPRPPFSTQAPGLMSAYGRRAVEDESEKVAAAGEGTRHFALIRSAFKLGQLAAGGEVSFDDAASAMRAAGLAAKLPEAEVVRTVRDGVEAGSKFPRSATRPNGRPHHAPARNGSRAPAAGGREPPVTPVPAGEKPKASRFKFRGVVEFLAGDYKPRWLVPRILVKGQPGVIAAPSKGMKTSILLDLAASLATGTPFLGKFGLNEKFRVAVCSGESGEHTIKETLLRVLAAKGVSGADADGRLTLEFNLPVFTDLASMLDFRTHVERVEADVLVIDPTYLAMGDVDAKNLFEMGGALRAVGDHLKAVRPDLTVILVHHANRLLPVGEVMELQHLAYSGLEQYCRQYFLMNRREPYRNDGVHDLWFRVGGSAGHGGLWALHIDEGLVDEQFAGRRWDVDVLTPAEAGDAGRVAREREKAGQRLRRDQQDEAAVLLVIDAEAARGNPGASVSLLGDRCEFGDERVKRAVDRLLERGAVVKVPEFQRASGHGAKVTVKNGFGRPPDD